MATNKIYFNNTTTPVTLNGVYYNGTKIEGCKGIKLNGTVVVSFETVIPDELDWQPYIDAYNAVWTSTEDNIDTERLNMVKMTALNEFAIARTRWMMFTNSSLLGEAGIETSRLFDFNGDGKVYISSQEMAQAWHALHNHSGTFDASTPFIIETNLPDAFAGGLNINNGYLTGTPLVYKRAVLDSSGQFTGFEYTASNWLDSSVGDSNPGGITQESDGSFKIHFNADAETFVDYAGNRIKLGEAISGNTPSVQKYIDDALGINSDYSGLVITTEPLNWGVQEFLNALSNVYIPGFGPYYVENDDNSEYLLRNSYSGVPNPTALSRMWDVDIDEMPAYIRVKPYSNGDISSGDVHVFILTGPLLENQTDLQDYRSYGEDNPYNIIWVFCLKNFYDLYYPNVLCQLNNVWCNQVVTLSSMDEGRWVGLDEDRGSIGSGEAAYILPSDFNSLYPDVNTQLDESMKQDYVSGDIFVASNSSLNNTTITCTCPDDTLGDTILDEYRNQYPSVFPDREGTSGNSKVFELMFTWHRYPSYADCFGDAKWYLNSYVPYNVVGIYPVKVKSITGINYYSDHVIDYINW